MIFILWSYHIYLLHAFHFIFYFFSTIFYIFYYSALLLVKAMSHYWLIGQKTCFANPNKKDNCPLYGVHSRQ